MGIDTGLGTTGLVTQTTGDVCDLVEREAGIEPASLAWKAKVLPLNYSRPEETGVIRKPLVHTLHPTTPC